MVCFISNKITNSNLTEPLAALVLCITKKNVLTIKRKAMDFCLEIVMGVACPNFKKHPKWAWLLSRRIINNLVTPQIPQSKV